MGPPTLGVKHGHWVAKDPSPSKQNCQLPDSGWAGWAGAADLGRSVIPSATQLEREQAPAASCATLSLGIRSYWAFLGHPEPIHICLTS